VVCLYAGFQDLPNDVQSKVLSLAAAESGDTQELRRVCCSWHAHALLHASERTHLTVTRATAWDILYASRYTELSADPCTPQCRRFWTA
jgi:hypothetical protein